jgi:hypothetical protein
MKNIIFYWSSDSSTKSGEGILANRFLSDLKKYKKSKVIKVSNNYKYQNITVKNYIYPFIGIFKLWVKYLKGYKICYINYLPLWNFLIFFLLPSKVILGPITGTISIERNFLFKTIFEKISIFIIKIKFDKCLFANNFYSNFFKNHYHNYIIKNLKFSKIIKKNKVYDFVFYYRKKYDDKLSLFHLIKYLNQKKYKIVVIGEKIKIKKIICLGSISRKKLNNILSKTRCAIANKENLYSYFAQNCLSHNLTVFYNHEFKKLEKFKLNNFYTIPYNNLDKAYKTILKMKNKPTKANQNIEQDFSNYFKDV